MMILYSIIIGGLSVALSVFLIYLYRMKNKICNMFGIKEKSISKILEYISKNAVNLHSQPEKEYLCNNLCEFIDYMPFGMLTVDVKDHSITSINLFAKEILNIKDSNVIGKKYYVVCKNYKFLTMIDDSIEEFKTTNKKRIEKELILEGSKTKYIKIIYEFPNNSKNKVIIILIDMTLQREIEEKSRKLVSDVAHELRTPLTSIHGFAETLLDPNIEEEYRKKFLKIIESESSRLSRLINEILDIVRMENKKTKMKLEPVNLSEIVTYVTEIVSEDAKEKNIKIFKDIEPNIKILGNEDKLVQATLNIIDNAIKYSASIGNRIDVTLKKEKSNAILEISDNGPGIPSVYLDKIFERFFRVDKSRTSSPRGSGLGLSIVKSIIEYHKGIIEAESEVGKGATFIIILPLLNENNFHDIINKKSDD